MAIYPQPRPQEIDPLTSSTNNSSSTDESTSSNSSVAERQTPAPFLVNASLVLGQVFFGLGSVIAALGLPACNPFAFALYREICAGMILLGASEWTKQKAVSSSTCNHPLYENPLRFILLGLAIFANQAGVIVGIKLSGPVAAAVWQPSQPIMTAAICMASRWEPFNVWRLLGVGIAFGGCALMVILSSHGVDAVANPVSYLIGNCLFFVNCLGTSLYVILSKKLLHSYTPLTVTAWSYNIASFFMALTAFLASLSAQTMDLICPNCTSTWHIPSGAYFALGYFIVFNSVAAYAILTWANQYATGTLVMGFTVLQPVTAALLTLLLLGLGAYPDCSHLNDGGACLDPPGISLLCGMVSVFAGLILVIKTEPKIDRIAEETDEGNEEGYERLKDEDLGLRG